jgi:hypothetical protein
MTMTNNTKMVLAAALLLGTASAALANDVETNPSTAQSTREWQEYLGQSSKHMGGNSYGYFASPSQRDDSAQWNGKGRSR